MAFALQENCPGSCCDSSLKNPSSREVQALQWVLNLGFNGNEIEFTTGIPDSCWNDQRHITQVKLAPGLGTEVDLLGRVPS